MFNINVLLANIMKLYGTKLKTKRLGRGWSQTRTAKKAKVSNVTIHRAEKGLSISPELAARICEVLDTDLRDMMQPLDEGNAA